MTHRFYEGKPLKGLLKHKSHQCQTPFFFQWTHCRYLESFATLHCRF